MASKKLPSPTIPLMFDAHNHLDQLAPAAIGSAVADAQAAGVAGMVIAGVSPDHWADQQALCTAHDNTWFTAGLHPWWVAAASAQATDAGLAKLESLLATQASNEDSRLVGVGELGLDRMKRTPPESLPLQEHAFRAQLRLARAFDLPLVLHIVRHHGRALEVLAEEGIPTASGMVHSFSGSAEMARAYLDLGLHLSFSGSITWAHADKTRAALVATPIERLLLETDAPDQAPEPHRSEMRPCAPAHLAEITAFAADVRGEKAVDTARETALNARRLFRIA